MKTKYTPELSIRRKNINGYLISPANSDGNNSNDGYGIAECYGPDAEANSNLFMVACVMETALRTMKTECLNASIHSNPKPYVDAINKIGTIIDQALAAVEESGEEATHDNQ